MQKDTTFLANIGLITLILLLITLVRKLWRLTRALIIHFVIDDDKFLLKNYGTWALITGCTDGIGKAYAFELAKKGLNIVLVSRNMEKLRNIAMEIETLHNVETKIIQADFSLADQAIQTIKKELGEMEIGILVNNVGMAYEFPMYLNEVSEQCLWDIIIINMGAATLMCRMLIPRMKETGRGAIVNISSGTELHPIPLLTVYAASKAYMRSFTMALQSEYGSTSGITIQHVCPHFVVTKISNFSDRLQRTSVLIPNATDFARQAVWTLGKLEDTSGYWSHEIQYFLMSLLPKRLQIYVCKLLMKVFRRDYLSSDKLPATTVPQPNAVDNKFNSELVEK